MYNLKPANKGFAITSLCFMKSKNTGGFLSAKSVVLHGKSVVRTGKFIWDIG